MKRTRWPASPSRGPLLATLAMALAGVSAALAAPAAGQEPPLFVFSPKGKSAGWTGVHRPHTKLSDVLARHAGQADLGGNRRRCGCMQSRNRFTANALH